MGSCLAQNLPLPRAMQLDMNEHALVEALQALSPDEQSQFFSTLKVLLGLPVNLREAQTVTGLAQRFEHSGDARMAELLDQRLESAMQLRAI